MAEETPKTKEEIIADLEAQNIQIAQTQEDLKLILKKTIFQDPQGHLLEAFKRLNGTNFYFDAQKDQNESMINKLKKGA